MYITSFGALITLFQRSFAGDLFPDMFLVNRVAQVFCISASLLNVSEHVLSLESIYILLLVLFYSFMLVERRLFHL